MSTAQYYQIRLQDAIALYREGNLTACGLLKLYIKIKFAPGWQIGLIPEQVCQVLGIAKATFYKALAKVKEQSGLKQIKLINKIMLGDEHDNTHKPKKTHSPTVENNSTTIESKSTTVESESSTVENESTTVENEPPKEASSKQHSESPDLYSNIYTEFISNLSSCEREKFLEFCQKRTDSFEIPLKCGLNTFLAAKNKETGISYFVEFWELYKKEGDVALNPTKDKHNTRTYQAPGETPGVLSSGMKPDFQKWYYWMNQLGIMVKKYDWKGEVGAIDNCGVDKNFEEWLKTYSMEEAKQRFDVSNGWGR